MIKSLVAKALIVPYIPCKFLKNSKHHCSEVVRYIAINISEIAHFTFTFHLQYSVHYSRLTDSETLAYLANEAKNVNKDFFRVLPNTKRGKSAGKQEPPLILLLPF